MSPEHSHNLGGLDATQTAKSFASAQNRKVLGLAIAKKLNQ